MGSRGFGLGVLSFNFQDLGFRVLGSTVGGFGAQGHGTSGKVLSFNNSDPTQHLPNSDPNRLICNKGCNPAGLAST